MNNQSLVDEFIKTSLKEKNIKEPFNDIEELRDYLGTSKIYQIRFSSTGTNPEFGCSYESGGLFDFQWGGKTLFFKKDDFWIRIFVSHIKKMYTIKNTNSLIIETTKGIEFTIICEPNE